MRKIYRRTPDVYAEVLQYSMV